MDQLLWLIFLVAWIFFPLFVGFLRLLCRNALFIFIYINIYSEFAFCFETGWINHPDFHPKVKEIWEKPVRGHSITDIRNIKIKRVKKFLKGWSQNIKGHRRKEKNDLQNELLFIEILEEDNSLSAKLLQRKTDIQTELLKMLAEEEQFWHKRSNSKWLLKGDNNTEFFHRGANGKKRKNRILSLTQDNLPIEGDEEILDHATQYYKQPFGPSAPPSPKMDSKLLKK